MKQVKAATPKLTWAKADLGEGGRGREFQFGRPAARPKQLSH
jgi:hypothetical protein